MGNRIECGNKTLVLDTDGLVKYLADGRLLATIHLPFRLVDKAANKTEWLSTDVNWPAKFFDLKESGMTTRAGHDVYRKVIQNGGARAECVTAFELLPDGRISLRYTWTPFSAGTAFLLPSMMMIASPKALSQGAKYVADGETGVVPDGEGGIVFRKPRFTEAALWATDSATRLTLFATPSSAEFVIEAKSGGTQFRIGSRQQYALEVLIDLRPGLAKQTDATFHGGIDFKAIDDLELPDESTTTNLMMNSSFENGLEGYWTQWHMSRYSGPDTWKAQPYLIDATTAFDGQASLKLVAPDRSKNVGDYRFIGRPIRTFSVPLEKGTYTFSFYAKGTPGRTQRVALWFPGCSWFGSRNIFLPHAGANKVFDISPEWSRYVLTFTLPQSAPVFASLGADTEGGDSCLWLDGLQLERGAVASPYAPPPVEGVLLTSRDDNFLSPTDRVDAVLSLRSKPATSGKARVSVKDFFGESRFDETFSFTCGADGRAKILLPFERKFNRGVFVVKVDYDLGGGTRRYEFHRFAVMEFLDNTHRLKNIFSDDYASPEGRADFLKLLERYKRIGIGAKSHLTSWDQVVWETYRAYGVEPLDASMMSGIRPYVGGKSELLGFAIRETPFGGYGMTAEDPLILVRDYHYDGTGEPTEEYLAKFRSAAADVAKRHPWIPLWTFSGEMFAKFPSTWWSSDGSDARAYENFAKVLRAFYLGVKDANPETKVYQDAPCNMSPEGGIAETGRLLREVNKAGNVKFDMIGIHTYRKRPENPDLDADTQRLLTVLDNCGHGDVPVFWPEGMHYGPYAIPEWGVESASWLPPSCWYYGALSYDMGWTEKVSAAWRARSWLVALKYQDRVKSFTSSAFVNNLEMDLSLTPFATQKIPNTLGHLLGDATFKKDIRFAPYVRCYVFEDTQKRPVAAIWCCHPKLDAGVMTAPEASADFQGSLDQVFDLMEQERAFSCDAKGGLVFPVSSFPLFFRGKPGTLAAFSQALESAVMVTGDGVSPVVAKGKPTSPDVVEIEVENFTSRPFEGKVVCALQERPVSLPGSGSARVSLPLPQPLDATRIVEERLPLVVQSGSSSFTGDVSFNGLLSQQTATEIKVDGLVEDWAKIPSVPFKNRCVGKGTTGVTDADFSGWFRSAWTEKGLYVCVGVRDDKFVHDAFEKPGDRWCNDSLQIYVDTLCDGRTKPDAGYDENDYDYAVYPAPSGAGSVVFRRRSPDPQLGLATQAPRDGTIAEDIPSAFAKTAEGYVYEVFFPSKYLLPMRLQKGCAVGLGLYVNDCDDPSLPYPRRIRSALTVSPEGTECYNAPYRWPTLLLWN